MRKINLDILINNYEVILIDQWGVIHNGLVKLNAVDQFINLLKNSFTQNIYLIDERLSSITAKKIMQEMNIKTGHNKEKTDQISAAIILQEYLDSAKE